MLTIIIKFTLFLFGMIMLAYKTTDFIAMLSLLVAISIGALNQYFKSRPFTITITSIYLVASIFWPTLVLFLPIIFFDVLQVKAYKTSILTLMPLVIHWTSWSWYVNALLLLTFFLAVVLQYMCVVLTNLIEENRLIHDNSTELRLTLNEQNKSLLEKHDNDINLATLKERNRIAREIHDNVGHLLSRSILQMGALQAINKDPALTGHLASLHETLASAMDNIRGSVHDLRDESIDLHASLIKMLEVTNQEIDLDYDVSNSVPNNVKYCFLSILKEATTNINKHSDASVIHIVVREQPALYQLLIRDNGSKKPKLNERGMGLTNMEERVTALGGNFNTSYQKGFRIFISIPKTIK